MGLIREDRVCETSTTTGTVPFVLAAAVTGFRRFSAVMAVNDTCYYAVEAVDTQGSPTGEWETGQGTYSAADTLTRTTVHESSNAGAAVNFAAGTKRVMLAMTSAALDQLVGKSPGKLHWRLFFPAGSGVYFAHRIAEVTFAAVTGGGQLAVGGTASATNNDTGHPASQAFNGVPADEWASLTFGSNQTTSTVDAWLRYDFTTVVAPRSLVIQAANDAEQAKQVPREIRVQWSDDGAEWVTLTTIANPTEMTASEIRTFTLPEIVDPTSINDLGDVDTATTAPTEGQTLVWDNTAKQWKPGAPTPTAPVNFQASAQHASLGTGTQQAIAAGAFTTVAMTMTTDSHNGWDATNNIYTIPRAGTYLMTGKVKAIDQSPLVSYALGIDTANADGPTIVWGNTDTGFSGQNRQGRLNTIVRTFAAGDQVRMFVFSDGATLNLNGASLAIVELR